MTNISPHEPIASRFTLSPLRRLCLPKRFCTQPPYWLYEVTPEDGADWLYFGFCHDVALSHLRTECGTRLQVIAECRSPRLTLLPALCEKYSLVPGGHGWFVTYGNHLEVWAENVWNREIGKALTEFLNHPA